MPLSDTQRVGQKNREPRTANRELASLGEP
jgi:hypothetical protein